MVPCLLSVTTFCLPAHTTHTCCLPCMPLFALLRLHLPTLSPLCLYSLYHPPHCPTPHPTPPPTVPHLAHTTPPAPPLALPPFPQEDRHVPVHTHMKRLSHTHRTQFCLPPCAYTPTLHTFLFFECHTRCTHCTRLLSRAPRALRAHREPRRFSATLSSMRRRLCEHRLRYTKAHCLSVLAARAARALTPARRRQRYNGKTAAATRYPNARKRRRAALRLDVQRTLSPAAPHCFSISDAARALLAYVRRIEDG